MPNHNFFRDHKNKTLLLALVTPLQTNNQDATKTLVSYTAELAPIIMDFRSVKALTGRVQVKNQWWIIDQYIPTLPDASEDGELDDDEFLGI